MMNKFGFDVGITHAGTFHADEVFATAMLRMINPGIEIRRVPNVTALQSLIAGLSKRVIVYDIGGGDYDHHQAGGNDSRPDGTPYSSAGLIWRDFGYLIIDGKTQEEDIEIGKIVDRALIEAIDAIDNGCNINREHLEFCVPTASSIISSFNPTWDSDENENDAFEKAVEFAMTILNNTIEYAWSKFRAREEVKFAIAVGDKHVIVLDKYVPWQEYLLSDKDGDEVLFVVFPSNRGGYNVQAVPVELGSFEFRKGLPKAWRGLDQQKLREVTGISSITFIHPAGFIGGCETIGDAVKLARSAVSYFD